MKTGERATVREAVVTRKSRYQRMAEECFEFEVKKAETSEVKGEPLDPQEEAPPRTTQEISSAPGLPF